MDQHALPPNACDSHVHVFDPERYPFAPGRAYTPAAATLGQLQSVHQSLGIERVVLVQPSVYGPDNTCMMAALRELGLSRAKGIAVVDLRTVTPRQIESLHEAGVRGIRLNLHVQGGALSSAREQLRAAGEALCLPGWSLHVHASLELITFLLEDFQSLEKPVVLDHFAGGVMPDAASEEALYTVMAAMRRMALYVKLSAPYRLPSGRAPAAMARDFYGVAPDRVLWGSDWPHTGGSGSAGRSPGTIEPFRQVDNGQVLHSLLDCLPDPTAVRRLLVDNPAALYGFDLQGPT